MDEQLAKHDRLLENHWWHEGLRELITIHLLDELLVSKKPSYIGSVLDVGCGVGVMLSELHNIGFRGYGVDIEPKAIEYCKSRGLRYVYVGNACSLPFDKGEHYFDAIICMDVLYHQNIPNDTAVLKELSDYLHPWNVLIINEPAYEFMKSGHDKIAQTRHRYTLRELKCKLKASGFEIQKATYRNTLLFPLILMWRLLSKITGRQGSDLNETPKWLNELLTQVMYLENKILSRTNLPFGLSVFCVAYKKYEGEICLSH